MSQFLISLSQQRRYWIALIGLGIFLEATALYYQYALDEWPCVLCIHVRIWVMAFVLLGLLGLVLNASAPARRLFHGVNIVIMVGLLERSWRLLAVERGWIFGDCEMDLGMPPWLALDQWFPWLFEVQTSCGYTPLIVLDISMAELLLVLSAALSTLSLAVFIASWFTRDP